MVIAKSGAVSPVQFNWGEKNPLFLQCSRNRIVSDLKGLTNSSVQLPVWYHFSLTHSS